VSAPVLHVLDGPNAGAEIALTPGDWVLGSGAQADLTFAEAALAPAHLRLRAEAAALHATALADGVLLDGAPLATGAETALPRLALLRIGETRFATGPAGSDWASLSSRPAPQPAKEEQAAAEPPPAAPEPVQRPVAAALPTRRRRLWPAAVTLMVLLMLGGAGWALHPLLTAPPPPAAPAPDLLAETRAAVRGLGLQDRLRVTQDRGRILVSGQLAEAEQLRVLAAALRRAGTGADLLVATEDTMRDQAATVLRAFGIEGEAHVIGEGVLSVTGFAPSPAAAEAAAARLRSDVPGVQRVQDALMTPERARDRLRAQIAAAGLGRSLEVAASGRRISVTGLLPPSQMPAWTRLAEEFRREHGGRIALASQVVAPQVAAPRGLSLGAEPFILLDDGRRVGIGDELENAGRVLAIDAARVRVHTPVGAVDLPFPRTPHWIMEIGDVDTR
jgi:type III secretion protein D